MFFVNDKTLVNFGKFLTDIRNEKNLNFKEVSMATKIDIASLNRLEQGLIKKVNPLMLLKLAELYDVNILHFYTLLGYVDTKDIIKYNNTNAYTSNDDIAIPLFDSINNIENKEVSIGKMNIPFSNTNSNLCFAFYYKKDIFIAYKTKELNFYDLFIFKANSKYFISKYFILDSTIILNDIQDDYKLYTFDKSIVKVVGKIIFQTKKLAKE